MAFFINYVFCLYCIKVAALLNKIADLPKEHFSPLNPILYFQLLYLRLACCCDEDLFILPAGTGKKGTTNHQNTEKPLQTHQSKQDEKGEKYPAGKGT